MHLHYSPYFNGHTYINYSAHPEHNGGLMGESVESTEGLLSRLELMSGMAYPDETDNFKQQRALEYCQVLQTHITSGPLHASINNDKLVENEPGAKEKYSLTRSRLNVSTEILRWRDTLILAGWDRHTALPGKLSAISDAEPHIPAGSTVLRGTADRWYNLARNSSLLTPHSSGITIPSSLLTSHSSDITIQVHLPQVLVEPLIQTIIGLVDSKATYKFNNLPTNSSLLTSHSSLETSLTVLKFPELYQSYEWLTQQPPTPGQVIVCSDSQRLDNVLRCHSLPITTGEAAKGCHHVISDVRSYLDAPQSLIWLDCNGDYGFHYPYDFITAAEKAALSSLGIQIPDEQTMLSAVHSHIVSQLNKVQGPVTLISSAYDTATQLLQHPMVASALFQGGKETKIPFSTPNIPTKKNVGTQISFTPQTHYNIHKDLRVTSQVMSYSSLDQLIQFPFNFVTERELGLYEPYDQQDIKTEKGNVAHRVVRFLVHYHHSADLDISDPIYDQYFGEACTLQDDHTTKCDSILLLDENKFELEDLKLTLRDSLKSLSDIIIGNDLRIVDSEAEIPVGAKQNKTSVPLPVFGDSKAYVDLILKKNSTPDYYIFDFKYSTSSSHPDKLQDNKSIQFAFYEQMFKYYQDPTLHTSNPSSPLTSHSSLLTPHSSSPLTLSGIGYYLFPLHTLYVPDNHLNGGLTGADVRTVHVDTAAVPDTLAAMQASYDDRMNTQLAQGLIEEGEEQKMAAIDAELQHQLPSYTKPANLFPLDPKYKAEDTKGAPYTRNHLVLKNQIR